MIRVSRSRAVMRARTTVASPEARGTRLGSADISFTLLLRAVAAGPGSGDDPTVCAPAPRLRAARCRRVRARDRSDCAGDATDMFGPERDVPNHATPRR